MKDTKIINLFAGPGAGKSTIASGLFYELKKRNITCDAPYEFPKELVWENGEKQIKDQFYVIANQHRRIVRSFGLVDYIIMDSPILLSLVYKNNYTKTYPASLYNDTFDKLIFEIHNNYENINIFLNRKKTYFEDLGRYHDNEQSNEIDNLIINLLEENLVQYEKIDVGNNTIEELIKKINL